MFTKEQEQNQKKDAQDIIDHFPLGVINWYPFINKAGENGAKCILYVEQDQKQTDDVFQSFFSDKGFDVTSVRMDQMSGLSDDLGMYDYIICVGMLECCSHPDKLPGILASHLNSRGIMLLATDNRFGLRYFCGDRDRFTGNNFDGIENYCRVKHGGLRQRGGRGFSREEITAMLEKAGLVCRHCYSVYPSIEAAQLIYREDTFPNEEVSGRYFTDYNSPDTVFMEENQVLQSISSSSLFHEMANGFLFELTSDASVDVCADVRQVTLTMDRGRELDFATCIGEDKVLKKPLYAEGMSHLNDMQSYHEDMAAHGIHVVEGRSVPEGYEMPFVKAENGIDYFVRLASSNKDLFFKELDRFVDDIGGSSEVSEMSTAEFLNSNGYASFIQDVPESDLGICLKHCYIDMVPLNCFMRDGHFLFFDQEFRFDDYPMNALLDRVITILDRMQINRYITREEMLERYGLLELKEMWDIIGNSFAERLRNKALLGQYDARHRGDYETIRDNRLKINYSAAEYENVFLNIFKGISGRDVFVFGAGKYAANFINMYGSHLKIAGIIDNDTSKKDTAFHGIKVFSAEILTERDPDTYKVIICMLRFQDVYKQVVALGAKHIGVYYRHRSYELPWMNTYRDHGAKEASAGNASCGADESAYDRQSRQDDSTSGKKYNVGYVAGVFDLFHIGHLNLLRRAKEQCNYLIVGVVSDEQVRRAKKRDPAIPCTERMEIVRAIRYVDEVFEIPIDLSGTRDIFNMYHFDVQFSGSDYAQDAGWLADKRYLESHGAELVFLPYTNGTSSTQIRERLIKG